MIKMQKIKTIVRRAIAPVTIMFIPHSNTSKSLHINVPAIGVFLSIVFCCVGVVYLSVATIDIIKYRKMDREIREYSRNVKDFNVALVSLKKAQRDIYQLLSLGSREKILETIELPSFGTQDMGAIDIRQIRQQIAMSTQIIKTIDDFLRTERDIYMATPKGWPVEGRISSPFGRRISPISGRAEFHRGMDIASPEGTPILASAEGIVSYSGWNSGGGNVVVIEHGHGFSTYYAHNSSNAVETGQLVKRGDIIGYVGSTGNTTGSHLHYEIWLEDRPVNPRKYISGRS
jgi:murein DD-endopeptidase MepM/ murein hydrolase activator NlpD